MAKAKYNATPRTLAEGEEGTIQLDSTGRVITSPVTGTSATQVQGTAATDAAAVGNPVQAGGVYYAVPTLAAGDVAALRMTAGARLVTTGGLFLAGIDAHPNNTIQFIADNDSTGLGLTAGMVFNGSTWDRMRGDTTGTHTVAKPVTSGGLTPARVLTGTAGVIKASAGQLYKLASVRNANAAVRYLHLYNKATDPTLSSDTPVLTISLAASSVQNDIDIGGDIGVAFSTGIAWAYTTDNIAIPATAATSTELMFSASYK